MDKEEAEQLARKVRAEIPEGIYCYGERGTCPFWKLHPEQREQENGECLLIGMRDWEEDGSLLWDQCKECGIKMF